MGFYTWILDSNLSGNVMDEITYSSDSQRQGGFQSGTVASSIRVNTALRQSTLVTNALMNSMNLGSFSYENSLSDIKSAIDGFFAGIEVTPNPDMTGQTPTTLTGLKIGHGYYNVPSGGGGTNVVANPTLVGTEANLTGLQVGLTKYKVPAPDPQILEAYGLVTNIDSDVRQVPLFSSYNLGNKITVASSNIKIDSGIAHVKISGYISLFYTSSSYVFGGLIIKKGSTTMAAASGYIPAGASAVLQIIIPDQIVAVSENDVLEAYVTNMYTGFTFAQATPHIIIEKLD